MQARLSVVVIGVLALACAKEGDSSDAAELGVDESTGDGDGDGDGDGPGDGDGDATGDGDGDGTGDGDATGDGDGDVTGDGDGDDPTDTSDDACSDGDSGGAPFDEDDAYASPNTNEPMGGFVPESDIPSPNECDIFDQDCSVGEKCVPYSNNGGTWNANKCVPVLGDGALGDACVYAGIIEATDDCDASTICWGANGQGEGGTCTAICEGTAVEPICPVGTTCSISNQGSIALCLGECNPLSQDCPGSEACFWAGDAFSCNPTTSDIPEGQPCGFINDCAEGLMCIAADSLPSCDGSACCAAFCDLDCGAGVCNIPGTECAPFFEGGMAPAGSADIGVCIAG